MTIMTQHPVGMYVRIYYCGLRQYDDNCWHNVFTVSTASSKLRRTKSIITRTYKKYYTRKRNVQCYSMFYFPSHHCLHTLCLSWKTRKTVCGLSWKTRKTVRGKGRLGFKTNFFAHSTVCFVKCNVFSLQRLVCLLETAHTLAVK